MRAFIINPGATSTKIALWDEEKELWSAKVLHKPEDLAKFHTVADQLLYRMFLMEHELEKAGLMPLKVDCIVGRGGLLKRLKSGTYRVGEQVLEELLEAKYGEHASNLGIMMADQLSKECGNIPAFFTNPVSVDEMDDVARVSGFKGMERKSLFHALNQKAAAAKYAKKMGKPYEKCTLVVAHLGGGVSVAAHRDGRAIDVYNVKDEGAFGVDRCGSLPDTDLIDLCYAHKHEKRRVKRAIGTEGGVMSYLGTNDLIEIEKRIENGDSEAALIFEAMAYQLAKDMGAMHSVLSGKTEAVVLTGGMANSKKLVERIAHYAGYIAPFVLFPGEFEMEAMAKNALRALKNGTAMDY